MSQESNSPGVTRPSKVLIVEDSITFAGILKRSILAKLNVEIMLFGDYASAKEYLEHSSDEFFVALLDIVLPDAPNGEIIDLVVSYNIPSIVFTGEISEELRSTMWSKRIVDYVQKVNFDDIQHVVGLVDRLKKNISRKAVIVDESDETRALFRDFLLVNNFQILEASNGNEALELVNNEKVHLVITGDQISVMDGPTTIKEIRKTHTKAELPIIGFSREGGSGLSAEFLKSGANDYIRQPFEPEEFYCRVNNTLDSAEYVKTIKRISDNDVLTDVFSRSALFKYGEKLFAQQKRSEGSLVAVMIDIDNIKACNETYGQLVGDEVIRFVAEILRNRFRKGDVVSRYGGDSFCILCADMKLEYVESVFKELAVNIAKETFDIGEYKIKVTVSIGVNTSSAESLEEMISGAERLLQAAKMKGADSIACT
ncbi:MULTISPECIES: GGDEF domain-containing response regulator [unclassified Maridesulfovibrio]|uniref:GGDEF domain-containing response regulator n=1 Tax=unclassified Maridesulfovibrio TaxID=2794999 RepID=UPI003B3CDDFC